MERAMEQQVRERAGHACEYCHLPESVSDLNHVIDHVIARQHGGPTAPENLALACGRCNLYKGPNITGLDPLDRQLTRLFNPRADIWTDHFRWDGPTVVGTSPVGRATVVVLSLNHPSRLAVRGALLAAGKFPPEAKK